MKKDILQIKPAFKEGDEFVSVDGQHFKFYDQFTNYLQSKKNEKVQLNLKRDGKIITKDVTVNDEGKLGFNASFTDLSMFKLKTVKYSFAESIPAGIKKGVETTGDYLKQFKLFFKKDTKAYESLGGFATIGNIFEAYLGLVIIFGL